MADQMTSRPDDFHERAARIVARGLPCHITCCRDSGFLRLELRPVDGWTHLVHDDEVQRYYNEGWTYHISLAYVTVDEEAWARLCQRWHDTTQVLQIDRVTGNGVAVLAWAGLGADEDAWHLYMTGEFAYKWYDNHFGLHVSM